MKTYTMTRVSGQPDWATIPVLELNEPYKIPLEETPVRAWAQVAYNDQALLIHLWAREPSLRRELTGLLDPICEDSCLEFFFSPMEGDERYFNIEYNPNACRYLGFGRSITNLVRLVPEENNDEFCPRVTETEGGWELTYQIPYHFIRRFFPEFDPAPGKAIRANCYKCGDKTDHKHFLTWCPVTPLPTGGSFHQPRAFGRMIFG